MGCQPVCTKSKGRSKAISVLDLLRKHRKRAALAPPPTPATYNAAKAQLATVARDATPQKQKPKLPVIKGLPGPGQLGGVPNLLPPGTTTPGKLALASSRPLVPPPGLPGAGEGGRLATARLCSLSSLPGSGRGNAKTAAVKPPHVEKLKGFQCFMEKAGEAQTPA